MKYLLGLTLALLASAGIVYACAEGEVWQSDITTTNGQCLEVEQSWSKNNGFTPILGKWGCNNIWHGTWFKHQCHLSGHVINTCVEYEQIEVDNGQCVADNSEEDDNGDGEGNGDVGESDGDPKQEVRQGNSKSGTSLWTRLSNVTGTKYTPQNISLQDGLKLYDQIMAEKRRLWDLRDK
jgi:hypothetical protein